MAPCVAFLFAFVIFPLVYTLGLSFTNLALTRPTFRFIGIGNYSQLLQSPEFLKTLTNTGIIVGGAVLAELVLGLLLALLLSRLVRGKSIFVTLIAIPALIAPTAVGAIWKLMLQPTGLVNYMVGLTGAKPLDWLGSPVNSLGSVMLADVWQWTPFVALILLAGLTSIDPALYEAASVDGASGFQRFRWISVPSLRSSLLFAALFRTIDAVRYMDGVFIITGGGPGVSSQTATLFVYYQGFRFFRVGYSSAASWLLLILVSLLTMLLVKLIKENQ